MLGLLLLLFIGLPIVELVLLLRIGAWLGGWATIALVLLTGVVGAALARSQGARVVLQIRAELAAGRLPVARLVDGAFIFAAGLLLITPGIVSDVAGLLLLFPPTRALFRRWVSGRMRRLAETGRAQFTVVHGDAPFGARPPAPGTGREARPEREPRGRDVTDV